jgi:membrane-associated phospholipid phosphatase
MFKNPQRPLYPEIFPEDIFAFTLLVFSSLSLYFLIQFILPEKENIIDNVGFLIFRPFISPTFTEIARIVTFFGTGTFLVPSYFLIVVYLTRNKYTKLALITSIAVSILLLGWLLKDIFHRLRPQHHLVSGAGGYSFPSGHALGGFIFAGILVYLIWQTRKSYYIKWIFSVIAFAVGMLIGISRIYLHVHYATDVLGSLFIALLWLSLTYILFRLVYQHELNGKSGNAVRNIEYFPPDYYLDN